MAKNSERTTGPTDVQVFELTMDNNEDQNELNRRLRKPGEPECRASIKPLGPASSASVDTEVEKKWRDPGFTPSP